MTIDGNANPAALSSRGLGVMLLIVVLFAAATALSGNGPSLPLDEHEVYVARTAEEMLARHDWLVPHLNDEPRVRKPPISYWLVMIVDACNGGGGVVSEWEARVPSITAGVIMAALTLLLGTVLLNRWAGFISALMLSSSSGYVNYTHSARPEMVYAMWCTAGLLCFAIAHQRRAPADEPKAKWWLWAGWLLMGLATMTKGPQLPLMIGGGWMAWLVSQRRHREILPMMRPVSGLLILVAVTAWWYVLLKMFVPTAGQTLKNETVSRVFDTQGEQVLRFLEPYYLYRTAVLILPWVMFYFLAIASPWLSESRHDQRLRLLWWIVIVPMALLHVSFGRRWYYMLPVLPPLTLLMAEMGLRVGASLIDRGKAMIWKFIVLAHAAAMFAVILGFATKRSAIAPPSTIAIGLVAASATVVAILAFRRTRVAELAPRRDLIALALCGAVLMIAADWNGSLWSAYRAQRRDFGREISRSVPVDATLLGWRPSWEIEQYHCHRTIPSFTKRSQLVERLRQHNSAWLLIKTPDKFKLPADLIAHATLTMDDDDGGSLQLWRIERVGNAKH